MVRSGASKTPDGDQSAPAPEVDGVEQKYRVCASRTASEVIDDDAVIVNFDTSHYYGLNAPATAVWSLLGTDPYSIDDAATFLGATYDLPAVDVHHDVSELIAGLLTEGLVERADGEAATPTAARAPAPYVTPRCEKFGTLEQLMLAGE